MISVEDYFGTKINHPDATQERKAAAYVLLEKVNALVDAAEQDSAFQRSVDPDTGTEISGSRGGAGDGGFRLSSSTTGRSGSKHREGHAVDVYDPANLLDNWLTDGMLAQYGLYREHPDDTPTWCHLQDVSPGSGRRTFYP